LAQLEVTKQGDLFLPADDSYVQMAIKKDAVRAGDVFNLAHMHAVVIVSPKFAGKITTWDDFLAAEKIGLGNETTAIGKVLKQQLESARLWDALAKRKPTSLGNVNEVVNSV